MSYRTELRKRQRERAAARAAAGLPPKVPPRKSHYQTADIREAVQDDILSIRQQLKEHRPVVMDPNWHFDPPEPKSQDEDSVPIEARI